MSDKTDKVDKVELVNQFLANYADRAKHLAEKGSTLTGKYMACLTGMWTHALHRPMNSPFDSKTEGDLYEYFFTGFYASVDARGMNEEERQKRAETEKKRQKEDMAKYKRELIREKQKKNVNVGNTSFWTKKIF